LLHLAGLLPFIWLFWAASTGFSADPAKDIQHFTGRMALKFLLATLLVSPLARYAKQPLLIRTRRLLGLWCFAWATLHLTSYALLELGLTIWRCWPGTGHAPLSDAGYRQLADLLAGADITQYAQRKLGALATFAQLRLSCRDPRPHSLPVVGEDYLPNRSFMRLAGLF
jgi:sulfoxide reductase heme-binding subunit YedZ